MHRGELVGALCCELVCDKKTREKRVCISTLGVSSAFQGRAVGSRLLTQCIELARETGDIKDVFLHVQTDNEGAIRFYKRHGFESRGTVHDYYRRLIKGPGFPRSRDCLSLALALKGGQKRVRGADNGASDAFRVGKIPRNVKTKNETKTATKPVGGAGTGSTVRCSLLSDLGKDDDRGEENVGFVVMPDDCLSFGAYDIKQEPSGSGGNIASREPNARTTAPPRPG